jgi:hypothetical protein
MYLGESVPGPQSKAKLPSNTTIQNEKYKCKNNIKLIYLTFIHCTCKFEKHKQCFLSLNYEQTFPNKKHKQPNTHEKDKQSFPSENYNRTFHNKSIKNIPPVKI